MWCDGRTRAFSTQIPNVYEMEEDSKDDIAGDDTTTTSDIGTWVAAKLRGSLMPPPSTPGDATLACPSWAYPGRNMCKLRAAQEWRRDSGASFVAENASYHIDDNSGTASASWAPSPSLAGRLRPGCDWCTRPQDQTHLPALAVSAASGRGQRFATSKDRSVGMARRPMAYIGSEQGARKSRRRATKTRTRACSSML